MTDSNRRISHAALVAALISSPVFAASDPATIEQQLNALQQARQAAGTARSATAGNRAATSAARPRRTACEAGCAGRAALYDDRAVRQRSADAIRGGVQNIWTFGVNWYINTNVEVMLNSLHVDVDRLNPVGAGNLLPFGPTPATPPFGVQMGQDLDIYGLRTQYSF